MLGVFLVHVGEVFTPYGPLKNDQTSLLITVFAGFIFLWIMPLFFFLAGASAKFALEVRTAAEFLRERFFRLVIPYCAGVLMLMPPMWYITLSSHSEMKASFWAYYLQFFGNFNYAGGFGLLHRIGGHLWFLSFLFIVSAANVLPFFYLRAERGRTLISKAAGLCERFGLLPLFVLPVSVIQVAFKVSFTGTYDWPNLLYLLPFYLLGFVVFSDNRFERMIAKGGWTALLVGMSCFAFLGAMYMFGPGEKLETSPSWTWLFLAYSVIRSLNVWAWILFLVGMGMRFLNRTGRFYLCAVEIIMPFYILHYAVIRGVAFYVVRWPAGIAVKFSCLAIISFVLTVVLFEVFVKRLRVMRFLFGMKMRRG
jgi:glucans biosynthesis protein C